MSLESQQLAALLAEKDVLEQVNKCVVLDNLTDVESICHSFDSVTVEKHVSVLLAIQRTPKTLLKLAHDDLVARVNELLVVLNVLLEQDLLNIKLCQLVGFLLVESLLESDLFGRYFYGAFALTRLREE